MVWIKDYQTCIFKTIGHLRRRRMWKFWNCDPERGLNGHPELLVKPYPCGLWLLQARISTSSLLLHGETHPPSIFRRYSPQLAIQNVYTKQFPARKTLFNTP